MEYKPYRTGEDRIKGSVVGFAIGDALGAPVEFKKNRTEPVVDFEPSYSKGLKAGQFTDDTQHFEISLDSILDNGGAINLKDVGDRLVDWYQSGDARSLGRTTELAIRNLMGGVNSSRSGIDNINACGSLGVCRLMPYSLFSAVSSSGKLERADTRAILGVTHRHKKVLQMGELLNYMVQEMCYERTAEGTARMISFENQFLNKKVRNKLNDIRERAEADSDPKANILEIGNSGFVEDVMYSALYSTMKGETFEKGLLYAANGLGDSDSRAALTGALYGLAVGYSGIPQKWKDEVEGGSRLARKASKIYSLAK